MRAVVLDAWLQREAGFPRLPEGRGKAGRAEPEAIQAPPFPGALCDVVIVGRNRPADGSKLAGTYGPRIHFAIFETAAQRERSRRRRSNLGVENRVRSKLKCPLFVASEMSGFKVVPSPSGPGWFWGECCNHGGKIVVTRR